MVFARSGVGVLELINQLGSAFYGPVLAVFVLGVLTSGATARGVLAGLAVGLATNLALARLASSLSWLWWNPLGFLAATAVALAARRGPIGLRWPRLPRGAALLLTAGFVLMLAILAALPAALRGALAVR